jgi:hypothetical protein
MENKRPPSGGKHPDSLAEWVCRENIARYEVLLAQDMAQDRRALLTSMLQQEKLALGLIRKANGSGGSQQSAETSPPAVRPDRPGSGEDG